MMTRQAFAGDAIRTLFGRYGGAFSFVPDADPGAVPPKALMHSNPGVDWTAVTVIVFGCAKQAGEESRNAARMSALRSGMPVSAPGSTVSRLCGSGLDALGTPARIMGLGPAPAARKVRQLAGMTPDSPDVIEFNEAYAAQGFAVLGDLGFSDDDPRA